MDPIIKKIIEDTVNNVKQGAKENKKQEENFLKENKEYEYSDEELQINEEWNKIIDDFIISIKEKKEKLDNRDNLFEDTRKFILFRININNFIEGIEKNKKADNIEYIQLYFNNKNIGDNIIKNADSFKDIPKIIFSNDLDKETKNKLKN
jgi:hypothetical protein